MSKTKNITKSIKKDLPKPINTDQNITIYNLIEQRSRYNLNPPYQRDNVWENDWKIDLINSIMNDLPFAPITLVQKENNGEIENLVLDGKQRLTAIFDFIDGKFAIDFIIDGKEISIKYDDIVSISKNNKHKYYAKFQKLYSLFKFYNFKAIVYQNISLSDQLQLFERFNRTKRLNHSKQFCEKCNIVNSKNENKLLNYQAV